MLLRTQTLLSFLEKSSVGVSLSLFVDFSCRNYVMHMETCPLTLSLSLSLSLSFSLSLFIRRWQTERMKTYDEEGRQTKQSTVHKWRQHPSSEGTLTGLACIITWFNPFQASKPKDNMDTRTDVHPTLASLGRPCGKRERIEHHCRKQIEVLQIGSPSSRSQQNRNLMAAAIPFCRFSSLSLSPLHLSWCTALFFSLPRKCGKTGN